jgi:hypothetical protein
MPGPNGTGRSGSPTAGDPRHHHCVTTSAGSRSRHRQAQAEQAVEETAGTRGLRIPQADDAHALIDR